jgi:hypothetical protein
MNIAILNTPVYDYLTASLIEGLNELGHDVRTSEKSNYGNYLCKNEFIKFANNADIFIIGSNNYIKYEYLKDIKNHKTIFIDGSDSSFLEIYVKYPINLIFKREFLKNCFNKEDLIFPLPFAAEKRFFKTLDLVKDIDISFLATNNNFLRESIKNYLLINYNNNSITEHTKEISYSSLYGLPQENPQYFNILQRSKIVVNIPGYGWDCGRYWEAISNKAILLTYKIDIEIPNEFEDEKHIFSFTTLEQFKEKIEFCINNPMIVNAMSIRAYEHLLSFHTTKKRAEYFLEIIHLNYKKDVFVNYNNIKNIKFNTISKFDNQKFYLIKKIKNWKF